MMTSIYTLTIFTSAFLLFLIQPMISKLLLPHLGGSPAVWNTSMMFFQMLLLLGYAYAHFSTKMLGAKRQTVLHLALLVISLAWLPIAARTDLGFNSVEQPILWVVVSLFLSVGFPFFVLAANAPLLQYWLANTDHKDARDPYFLYSASNVGSLLALFSYPFILEPGVTLHGQTMLWSAIFVAFGGLIVACNYYLRCHYRPVAASGPSQSSAKIPAKTKLYWVGLAFFPSSLLLGVTTYITTDIASIPLFWVLPLAIYLLTFILAFAKEPLMVDRALNAQATLIPFTFMVLAFEFNFVTEVMLVHLFTFFAVAMGCHGTLARRKPDSRHLTEFYLWISFGGMLGGVFNSLLAPLIFTNPIEYPLILALSLFMRPLAEKAYKNLPIKRRLDIVIPVVSTVVFAVLLYAGKHFLDNNPQDVAAINEWFKNITPPDRDGVTLLSLTPLLVSLLFIALVALSWKTYQRPVRFALAMGGFLLVVPLTGSAPSSVYMPNVIYSERNFFGVNRVIRSPQTESMVLMHGTTLHGMQSLLEYDRLAPVSYYAPLRQVFANLSPEARDKPFAVLGLGAGTLACLGQAGQTVDFYEIDPMVAAIAANPEFFTYLKDCPPRSEVFLGDGRLALDRAEDGRYGIMVMDAFSSDAIPMHLVTREALQMYVSKLAPGGVLAFNISNRHLKLAPVMSALADDAGLKAMIRINLQPQGRLSMPSMWVVMARSSKDFNNLRMTDNRWQLLQGKMGASVWTDNYSNILETLF